MKAKKVFILTRFHSDQDHFLLLKHSSAIFFATLPVGTNDDMQPESDH